MVGVKRTNYDVCTTEEAWHAARWNGIGASEALKLLRQPYTLWAIKVGLLDKPLVEEHVLRHGKLAEPFIAQLVIEETEVVEILRSHEVLGIAEEPHDVVFSHGEHSHFRATPDFFARTESGECVLLEMKYHSFFSKEHWADGPPVQYGLQAQQQMAVLNVNRCLVAGYFGPQAHRFLWVDRDPFWEQRLIQRADELWPRVVAGRRMLENGEDPQGVAPTVVSGDDLDALKVYRPEPKREIEIPGDLAQALWAARDDFKAAEKELNARKADLVALMAKDKAAIARYSGEKVATNNGTLRLSRRRAS